ncbi:MAG: molybdopterin biosynthesis protein MoeB [Burkholderiales bacterium PBB3]|nr:MAG: molybdopterin biosynthesis protein MoeB [Burkholderiales bacterium PBB3]
MQDTELLRYSRHILLDGIGIEGQDKIIRGKVLIVGAGGLGSPAAMYLASSGVGHITLVDDDAVELTNLQRQIVHRTASIGRKKVESAAETISGINPLVCVSTFDQRADRDFLNLHVPEVDLVLDCCDNFETRQAVNRACVRFRKPLVSGAAIQVDGQVSVYDSRSGVHPCYACIFPADDPPPEVQCSTMGVFAPLVGIIGAIQAAEALKLLSGLGISLAGRLLLLDGRSLEWTELQIARNPHCKVCGPTL